MAQYRIVATWAVMMNPTTIGLLGGLLGVLLGGAITGVVTTIQQGNAFKAARDLEDVRIVASRNLEDMRARRAVYDEALRLASTSMAAMAWVGEEVPENRVPEATGPTESEINFGMARLALYTTDEKLLTSFKTIFSGRTTPQQFAEFLSALRADLGLPPAPFSPEKYSYVFGRQHGAIRALPTDVVPVPTLGPVAATRTKAK